VVKQLKKQRGRLPPLTPQQISWGGDRANKGIDHQGFYILKGMGSEERNVVGGLQGKQSGHIYEKLFHVSGGGLGVHGVRTNSRQKEKGKERRE